MSWRTVIVKNRCKLSFKNNYLVVFDDDGEKTIHIDEIGTLIVESAEISITAYLLSELSKNKVKVILCDKQKNPHSELIPYYGSHNTSKKLKRQSKWTQKQKDLSWKKVVEQKINMQKSVLKKVMADDNHIDTLKEYETTVQPGDSTNREAHAARVYFKALFGDRFIRNSSDNIDSALNYGYTLLLSSFNKEIVSSGYSTSLGINHVNEFNPFNLSSDLMEPFRPVIDLYVYERRGFEFDSFMKDELLKIFEIQLPVDNKMQHLPHAIYQYTNSFFRGMEEDNPSLIAKVSL